MFAKQNMLKLAQMGSSLRMQAARQAMTVATRPAFMVAASRSFGSVNEGAKKLTRALDKEIKYENENYAQLEDIETFLNESGFAFSEEEKGIFMTLKKQVGDKLVEICFEAR